MPKIVPGLTSESNSTTEHSGAFSPRGGLSSSSWGHRKQALPRAGNHQTMPPATERAVAGRRGDTERRPGYRASDRPQNSVCGSILFLHVCVQMQ